MHLYRGFTLGIILSLLMTFLTSAAWVVVAMGQKELNPLIWMLFSLGVGLASGIGMLIGYDEGDDWGGLAAAFIALFGIACAHVALFYLVLMPLVNEKRDYLIYSGLLLGDESPFGVYMRLMTGPAEFFFLIGSLFCAYIFGRKGIPLGD